MEQCIGSLYGGFCGDAAGATLEFCREPITSSVVNRAMRMPGGGTLGVGKGQITDDSEMALALISVLANHDPRDGFPSDAVATAYSDWFKSNPFDCGQTCARATGSIVLEERWGVVHAPGTFMTEKAAAYNAFSQANGALMRCSPIALWARHMPALVIADYAKIDARLTHPHVNCQDANALFCVALAHLVENPGDVTGALEAAGSVPASDAVKGWLLLAASSTTIDDDDDDIDCTVNVGWVKHAFVLAFRFLRRCRRCRRGGGGVSYEIAIFKTLLKAGDTDTNAKIVGDMMGAVHGISAIPRHMLDPVFRFNCVSQGITRPSSCSVQTSHAEKFHAMLRIESSSSSNLRETYDAAHGHDHEAQRDLYGRDPQHR